MTAQIDVKCSRKVYNSTIQFAPKNFFFVYFQPNLTSSTITHKERKKKIVRTHHAWLTTGLQLCLFHAEIQRKEKEKLVKAHLAWLNLAAVRIKLLLP